MKNKELFECNKLDRTSLIGKRFGKLVVESFNPEKSQALSGL